MLFVSFSLDFWIEPLAELLSARDKLRCIQVRAAKGLEPTVTVTELDDALRFMPTIGGSLK
jgi:hypothetical protein